MIHFSLNRNNKQSLVDQIYQQMADRIASGQLEHGTRLPSVRDLSRRLNVAFVTVTKAYERLEQDGYIEKVHGKGTFVRREGIKQAGRPENDAYGWQLSVTDYLPRAQAVRHFNTDVFQFATSVVYPRLLPGPLLREEMHRILKDDPFILTRYGEIQGDYELRLEMTHLLKEKGIHVKAEEMLITSGVQQGIELTAKSFVGPGDHVVMETPSYYTAVDAFRARGADIVPVPVDEHGMRVDLLQQLCKKISPKVIYTNPTFQNPTGTVLSTERRKELIEIAKAHNALIIEDDSWSELYYEEPPPPSIKTYDREGHVIYLKGLSKFLSAGCRIAAVAASGSVLNRLLAAKALSDIGSPLLTQKAILAFIRSKRIKDHLQKLRIAMEVRRDRVHELLSACVPHGVTWQPPKGGLNFWLTMPRHINTDILLQEARKHQLSFLPGSVCYSGEPEYHQLRISFTATDEPSLERGITQLCNVMNDYMQKASAGGVSPLN